MSPNEMQIAREYIAAVSLLWLATLYVVCWAAKNVCGSGPKS